MNIKEIEAILEELLLRVTILEKRIAAQSTSDVSADSAKT